MKFRIVQRPSAPTRDLSIRPSVIGVRSRPLRVLDFDVEARPLHWIASDYVSKEITAMAWAWTDKPDDVTCYLLGETDPILMLREFVKAYNQADLVTGHFIRGYDLPMINGALMEYRLPVLGDKATQDTKGDLVRRAGLSMSQESLGSMLRLDQKKVTMNQAKWRSANRLEPEGRELARERVTGDVKMHIEMRRELLALNYLAPVKTWRSGSARVEQYTP